MIQQVMENHKTNNELQYNNKKINHKLKTP